MKNGKKGNIFLIISGSIILGVFISISMINIAEKDDYYLSTDIIRDIIYDNGKLEVTARSDITSVCIKTTKSEPKSDSLCWMDTVDNRAITSIYEYKTYYIWAKDYNNVISYYNKYNLQNG